jgi:A/G-specific adenine glycosylase
LTSCAGRGADSSDARRARALRGGLLRWYRLHRRDLPWRRTHDPYAVWVSEIMLQQTRVATVLPYYERFLERFPTPERLAAASEEEVLAAWSGLGYYRRARSLREAARLVVERHDGRVPDDPKALRELPGVGRYTAGAIASVAFDRPEPVLDGNVERVLARLLAVRDPRRGARGLWDVAAAFARGPRPGDVNQALMELGALVCTPRQPGCPRCPLRASCRAARSGSPERYPRLPPARATERVRVAVAWAERSDRVMIERRTSGSPLRGAWDLPAVEVPSGASAARSVAAHLRLRHRVEVQPGEPVLRLRHGILHRRLELEVVACRAQRTGRLPRVDLRWLERSAGDAPVSGATRKILRALWGE